MTTEFERIEEVVAKWEDSGILGDHPDPANLALCLRTQTKLIDSGTGNADFRRTALAIVVKTLRENPRMLSGLLDGDGFSDVYCICDWRNPLKGSDEEITDAMEVVRLIQEKVPAGILFGGLYEKNGKVAEGYRKYKEWEKTQKKFYVDYDGVRFLDDGTAQLCGRNGDHPIGIGDMLGGEEVLKIEAYGTELDELGQGMTGFLTVTGVPGMVVEETDPELRKWIEEVRAKRRPVIRPGV